MCWRLQPYVLEAATLCVHPVFSPVQALLGGLAGIPSLPPRLAEQPLFAAQAYIHIYIRFAAQGMYTLLCTLRGAGMYTRRVSHTCTCTYVHAHFPTDLPAQD